MINMFIFFQKNVKKKEVKNARHQFQISVIYHIFKPANCSVKCGANIT